MKKNLLVFFVALFVTACEEDVNYTYSGTYCSTVKKYSAIRMFTNGAEVKDNAKILDFYLRRVGEPQIFLTDYTKDKDLNGVMEFIIEDDNVSCNFIGNIESRRFIAKGSDLFFEYDEIFTRYNFSEMSFYDKLFKNSPIYSVTIPLPQSSGFYSKTEFKPCYYLNGNESLIEFPSISYFYLHMTENESMMESGGDENNEFNSSIISSLTVNDTLLIQESKIIFVKE